ncbi:MAG: glycerol-3-phosphate acyltransferase [Chloroflexi bacterium]|nr:glycerol-3-phosphate acyltransferase [Chloroflexota bacterium]
MEAYFALALAALLIGAYLVGSVPTAYIAARLTRGIDIRRYGSGNVGSANVWESVSRWAFIPVAAVDVGKGTVAVAAAQWLNFGLAYEVMAGVAAVAGHNWSVFLGFKGGRGVGASLGILLVLAQRELAIVVAVGVLGLILGNIPLAVIIGFCIVPVSAWALGQPLPVVLGCLGILGLVAIKRLVANGLPAAPADWKAVALNRLLFDRDIRDREAWVQRSPGETPGHRLK